MEPGAWKVHHFTMFSHIFQSVCLGNIPFASFCMFVPYIFPEGATPQPANDRIQGMSHNFHELQIADSHGCLIGAATFLSLYIFRARSLISRATQGLAIEEPWRQLNITTKLPTAEEQLVTPRCACELYTKGWKLFEIVFVLNPLP